MYLDPLPEPEAIPALYPETYYTVNPDSPLYLQGMIYRTKITRDVRRMLKYFGPSGVRSVVDIGCGDTARLFAFQELLPEEVQIVGVDLQFREPIVQKAAEHGVRLVEGNLEVDLDGLADDGQDFMMMCQLIEHLRDPRRALGVLLDKLSPGGRLLIETPNRGGLDFRLFRKRFWGGYHIPRHFHLYTQDSLRELCESVGYRVVSQGSLPSPGFWIISLRNMLGLNSARSSGRWLEFLSFSNLLVVGAFTALDLARTILGLQTSTQYLLVEKTS